MSGLGRLGLGLRNFGRRGSSIGGSPAVNTVAPSISGTRGGTLTATPGTWTGATSVSGQWYADGVATGNTTTSYNDSASSSKILEYRVTAMPGSVVAKAFPKARVGANMIESNWYMAAQPQVDLAKGDEFTISTGTGAGNLVPDANRDSNGYPSSMPSGATQLVTGLQVPNAAVPYKITFSDPGATMTSAQIINGTGGNISVTNGSTFTPDASILQGQRTANFLFQYAFTPSGGNYPKDISVRPVTDPGGTLNQPLIDKITGANAGGPIRFIKWSQVEKNGRPTDFTTLKYPVTGDGQLDEPIVTSANRNTVNAADYGKRDGTPVEICIQVATAANADAWYNAIWNADSTFYAAVAALWAQFSLSTGKTTHVECANEVWNSAIYTVAVQATNEANYRGQQPGAKTACRVVATGNITLSGTQTIDGVSVVAGDRVLVAGQSTASQNGVYVVAAGAWARATDADATGEILSHDIWFVSAGTTYANTSWFVATTGTITIGTTAITISQFTAQHRYGEKAQQIFSAFQTAFASAGVSNKLECVIAWQNTGDTSNFDKILQFATSTTMEAVAAYWDTDNATYPPTYTGDPTPLIAATYSTPSLGIDAVLGFALIAKNHALSKGLKFGFYEFGCNWTFNDLTYRLSLFRSQGAHDTYAYAFDQASQIFGDVPTNIFSISYPINSSSNFGWGLVEWVNQPIGANTPRWNAAHEHVLGQPTLRGLIYEAQSIAQTASDGDTLGPPPTRRTTGVTYSLSDNDGGRIAIDPTTGQLSLANVALLTTTGTRSVTIVQTNANAKNGPTFSQTQSYTVTAAVSVTLTPTNGPDKSDLLTLSDANLSATGSGAFTDCLVRATAGAGPDKFHLEITNVTGGASIKAWIGLDNGATDLSVEGVVPGRNNSAGIALLLGDNGWTAYQGGGGIDNDGSQSGYWPAGSILIVEGDKTAGTVTFIRRVSGTNNTLKTFTGVTAWTAFVGTQISDKETVNFGGSAFASTPSAGYSAYA